MRCPACSSAEIITLESAGVRCDQTGYDDSGPAARCLACGAVSEPEDFDQTPGCPPGWEIPRPRLRPDPEPLTARELEIAALVADARANKEIGARLGIAERTVKVHLWNIFGKLGVRERTSLVLWYVHQVLDRGAAA